MKHPLRIHAIALVAFAFLCIAVLPCRSFSQNAFVDWSAIDMGFAQSTAVNVRLKSVVGQPFVFKSGSGNTWVAGGFLVDTLLRGTVTGIDTRYQLPTEFSLDQNYPNPFNPSTTIRFAVPHQSRVTLVIHNLLGQLIRTLVDEEMSPGVYRARLDAHDLASGVYLYSMRAGGFVQTRKLMLLR